MLWLQSRHISGPGVTDAALLQYLKRGARAELAVRKALDECLSIEQRQLMNLAHDWLTSYTPHVLSKINRVSYGLLSLADQLLLSGAAISAAAAPTTITAAEDERIASQIPMQRRLVAVPFLGKDVPSKASEFAHAVTICYLIVCSSLDLLIHACCCGVLQDVLIGLTFLAYRYDGLRRSDMLRILGQLKRDFQGQTGPPTLRPSSVLFSSWMRQAGSQASSPELATASSPSTSTNAKSKVRVRDNEEGVVEHLGLLQLGDDDMVDAVYARLCRFSPVIEYYLTQHVCHSSFLWSSVDRESSFSIDLLFGAGVAVVHPPSGGEDLCQWSRAGRWHSVRHSPRLLRHSLGPAASGVGRVSVRERIEC